MSSSGNIYLLQYGSYITEEVMKENIKNLDNYIVVKHDDKFYVYIGAYINIDTAKKMQKYFENENIYTYLKNDYLTNMDVIDKIKILDNNILNENDDNKLVEINKEILDLIKSNVS